MLNGVDDVLVAGAAAEVAGDALPDFVLARLRVVSKQVGGAHNHAWRAETALQPVLLPESLLQRVERVRAPEASAALIGRIVVLELTPFETRQGGRGPMRVFTSDRDATFNLYSVDTLGRQLDGGFPG